MNSNVKILIADDEERWRRLVVDYASRLAHGEM